MRALITGAGGLVATALVPHFDDVFALRHAALDISNKAAVDAVVTKLAPDVIINCAVIGVDDCERDPVLAQRINVDGPGYLAEAAKGTGAAIVHFSSNYVFDGKPVKREPYTIKDEAHPINVYGRTKLLGEYAVMAASTRAFIIRTSWVYGNGRENFFGTVAAKLERGVAVRAIGDTWASSTYVADLAHRVREIIDLQTFGTYHVVNEGVCSYESFARCAAQLAGIPPEIAHRLIEVVSEASMGREAPRPRWTPMRCLLSDQIGLPPLRRWEDALAAYGREP